MSNLDRFPIQNLLSDILALALTAQMMAFENAAPGFDANVYTSPHVSIGLVTVDHYKTTLFHILELMMQ